MGADQIFTKVDLCGKAKLLSRSVLSLDLATRSSMAHGRICLNTSIARRQSRQQAPVIPSCSFFVSTAYQAGFTRQTVSLPFNRSSLAICTLGLGYCDGLRSFWPDVQPFLRKWTWLVSSHLNQLESRHQLTVFCRGDLCTRSSKVPSQ